MERQSTLWILVFLLFLGVSETTDPLTDLDNIAGKLIFYQTDGNATLVRDTGELASDAPTETMFELFDPQKNFSAATFTYTWDLGNGEVIQGTEPLVRYNYSESGNYTLRLKIGVNVTKYAPPVTGVYSRDVQVLDAIKHVELKGPSQYEVSQNTSLAFQVDGSPPMWVCWRFLPKCEPDIMGPCTLTMLHGNTLRLNHTFTSVGVHCLDINVRNDISKLQTSFSLYIRRNNHNQMIFILSCAAVLVATFSFIAVIACRPRHHNTARAMSGTRCWWRHQNYPHCVDEAGQRCLRGTMNPSGHAYQVQLLATSNAVFLKNQEADGQSRILFNSSTAERGEKRPLLTQSGPQYSS